MTAREGQGTRSNEALSLVGVGWVGLNAVHFCNLFSKISNEGFRSEEEQIWDWVKVSTLIGSLVTEQSAIDKMPDCKLAVE